MIKYIDRRKTIVRFRKEHDKLKNLVQTLSEEQAVRPKTVDGWSIKDIIAHLAAWNWEAIDEVYRVLKNEARWPFKYEDKAGEGEFNRKEVEKRADKTWKEVLQEWDNSFWAQIKLMEQISKDEWKHRSGNQRWSDGTPVTVYSLFAYEYEGEGHEGGHAKQLIRILDKIDNS